MYVASKRGKKPDPHRLRYKMVQEQLIGRGITDKRVLQAMSTVQRHLFVEEALAAHAYDDSSLPIGYGQTISQPYTVALMTQLLEVERGMRILEVGTGSGYQAAILASMGCIVYTIERIREVYARAKALFCQMNLRGTHICNRDGTLGMPEASPFQRIIVTAGGPEVPPPLIEQLDNDGILLIPVGTRPRNQHLVKIFKKDGIIRSENLGPVIFVELVGSHGW